MSLPHCHFLGITSCQCLEGIHVRADASEIPQPWGMNGKNMKKTDEFKTELWRSLCHWAVAFPAARQDAPAISCHWHARGARWCFPVICTMLRWIGKNQTLSAVKLFATVRRTWKSLKRSNLQHIIVQKAKETICSSRRWERRGFFYIAMTLSDSFAESDMGVAWCCLYDAKTFALHFRTCSWYLAVPCLSDWGGTFTSHKSISLDRRRSGSIACAQSVEMPEALEAQIYHQLMSKGKIWEADDYIPVSKVYKKTVQKPLRCGTLLSIPLFATAVPKKGSQRTRWCFWRPRRQRGFLSWFEDTPRQGHLSEAESLGREAYEEEKEELWFGCSLENIMELGIAGNYMLIYS